MKEFTLPRTKQCAKCPWKVTTDPFEIPQGYSVEKHKALKKTISDQGSLRYSGKAMACHHSNGDDEMYCIGWLYNQLGSGNNIGLRFKFMGCTNGRDIKVYGKQHERFEDTLPKQHIKKTK